ncbi:MAG: hypothetical protein ACOH5I_21380 [Oligoflexus sp.]
MKKLSWRFVIGIILVLTLTLVLWHDGKTFMRIIDIPTLGTGYRAKELCSCLYVMRQDPAYCETWTYELSLAANVRIEPDKREVFAYYTWFGSKFPLYERHARWIDEHNGCRLVKAPSSATKTP